MKLRDQLNQLVEDVMAVRQTMGKNTESLQEHVRRCNAIEALLQDYRDEQITLKLATEATETKISEFDKNFAFFKGVTWAIGVTAAALVMLKQLGFFDLFS